MRLYAQLSFKHGDGLSADPHFGDFSSVSDDDLDVDEAGSVDLNSLFHGERADAVLGPKDVVPHEIRSKGPRGTSGGWVLGYTESWCEHPAMRDWFWFGRPHHIAHGAVGAQLPEKLGQLGTTTPPRERPEDLGRAHGNHQLWQRRGDDLRRRVIEHGVPVSAQSGAELRGIV